MDEIKTKEQIVFEDAKVVLTEDDITITTDKMPYLEDII